MNILKQIEILITPPNKISTSKFSIHISTITFCVKTVELSVKRGIQGKNLFQDE